MAIKAPKVQTVAEAMAELNPAYSASKKVTNQRISGLGAKYDAQRAGITAEKGEGFNAINNQATGRGGSFSGVPVDEQARYLSTKYLPGMQMADFQENEEGLTYQQQLADMDKEARVTAIGRVDKQKSDLTSWNSARAAEEAAAREAEKQRRFSASEAEKQRNFTAGQNAMSRAATAAANAPKKLTPYESAMGIIGAAAAKGSVSSNAFQLARDAYRQAGGDAGEFASTFWKYVPKEANKNGSWKDYYYG